MHVRPLRRILFLIPLLAAGPAAGESQWFHVEVHDRSDRERVEVHLPLGMVEKVLAMTPRRLRVGGFLTIDGVRFGGRDLAEMVDAARSLESGESTRIRVDFRRVEITRDGAAVHVRAPSRWWGQREVEVRMPLEVMAAFAGSRGRELDLVGGLEAMARHPEGGVVTVQDRAGTTEARLWVDGRTSGGGRR